MVRAAIVSLIPIALFAQDTRCTVEGMVVNSSTGEGLRRAVVFLRRSDVSRNSPAPASYTAATDSEGKYVFSGLAPGTYVLSAERNGFTPARYASSVKLDPGQKASGLLVLMTPHAVITGRVLDDEGEPVVGAEVQASTLGYLQGRKQLTRAAGATTNDLGEYRVYGLPPGRYFLSVTARSNPLVAPAEEYATTYYPRTTDPAAAVPIPVPAGAQMRNIDVTLARTRTVSVRGKVECDIEGQQRTMFLSLTPRLTMGIASMGVGSRGAAVQADGTFEISRVAPGSYMLMATATVDSKRYATRVPLQVGGTNVEGVQVAIRAGTTVTGKVRVEGRSDEKLAGWNIGLLSWESGGVIYGPMPNAKTEADGSFKLEDVGADRYAFQVTRLPDGHYLKSVRSGSVDVMASGLEVSGAVSPLDVLISPSAGAVEGTVIDPRTGKPTSGATVVLVPRAEERSELYQRVATDQEGRFRIRNLVPGEYKLYAWEEVPPYAWMDPDFMRGMENKGEAVSISEGGAVNVQAKLNFER